MNSNIPSSSGSGAGVLFLGRVMLTVVTLESKFPKSGVDVHEVAGLEAVLPNLRQEIVGQ